MTTPAEPRAAAPLIEAIRGALGAAVEGLDVAAVGRDTPLGALIFDSLMATTFVAHLEALLHVGELPFEAWLLAHSERVDTLTVGLLADWLASLPELRGRAGGGDPAGR